MPAGQKWAESSASRARDCLLSLRARLAVCYAALVSVTAGVALLLSCYWKVCVAHPPSATHVPVPSLAPPSLKYGLVSGLHEAHLLFAPLHVSHGSTHTVHDAPLDSAKCPSTQAVHAAVCPELGAVRVAHLSIPLCVVLSTNTPAISSHFTTDCLSAVAPGGTKCPSAAFVHLPSDAAVQRVFPG